MKYGGTRSILPTSQLHRQIKDLDKVMIWIIQSEETFNRRFDSYIQQWNNTWQRLLTKYSLIGIATLWRHIFRYYRLSVDGSEPGPCFAELNPTDTGEGESSRLPQVKNKRRAWIITKAAWHFIRRLPEADRNFPLLFVKTSISSRRCFMK